MRFFEIASGVRVPVSQEEQELLTLATEAGHLIRSALDERQQEVSRLMVSRGLLLRKRNSEGQVVLEPNDMADMWRY